MAEEEKKKVTPKKTTATKTTAKTKAEPKKPATKKQTKDVKKKIDPKTGKVIIAGKKKKEEPKKVTPIKKKEEPVKKVKKKIAKKSSKELTIEPAPREPEVIVRPTPKKKKEFNKEEKQLYKELSDYFTYVANMTTVVEDRTMDRKQITDLTIGELHVVETVNSNNNKPMTLIAKKEHVTVGALTTCVNRLVQKGYLLRTRDEMDHRIILLSVTQKGKKVVKIHDEFHENILGLVLENGLTLQQANKVMSVFAKYIEGYYDPKSLEEKPTKKAKKQIFK